jgi:putative tryptophan/tyrosine transport system substrate-binding protein
MKSGRAALLILLCVAVLVVALAAEAQQAGKVYRIGVLSAAVLPPRLLQSFQEGLRELGYVEGKNVAIESRDAGGKNERLAALADELVQLKVDIILTVNTPATQAAKNATGTIPIVMTRVADPIKSGLVPSLARPGGNLTGVSSSSAETAPKQVQLLKEILPGTTRVAILWNGDNPASTLGVEGLEQAAAQVGLQALRLPVRTQSDLLGAFQAAAGGRAEALVVFEDIWLTKHRVETLNLAAKHRLPVISLYKDFVEAGGLAAYGASLPAVYRRAAYYVDRILNGAKPRDLPIEQPTKFDLLINLKTAKALGLTIPPSLLLRADQVIE